MHVNSEQITDHVIEWRQKSYLSFEFIIFSNQLSKSRLFARQTLFKLRDAAAGLLQPHIHHKLTTQTQFVAFITNMTNSGQTELGKDAYYANTDTQLQIN